MGMVDIGGDEEEPVIIDGIHGPRIFMADLRYKHMEWKYAQFNNDNCGGSNQSLKTWERMGKTERTVTLAITAKKQRKLRERLGIKGNLWDDPESRIGTVERLTGKLVPPGTG